jgi:hypothetical protein
MAEFDQKHFNRLQTNENARRKADGDTAHFWQLVARNKGKGRPIGKDDGLERQLFGRGAPSGSLVTASEGSIEDSIPVERSGPRANEIPVLESFAELSEAIPAFMQRNIQLMRYNKPSPIQKHSIPLGLQGVDLICCAQTVRLRSLGLLPHLRNGYFSHGFPCLLHIFFLYYILA